MSTISVVVDGRKESRKVKFAHKWRSGSGQWNTGDIIIAPKTAVHEIIFEIDPASPKKLRFLDDPNDAIWVGTSQCPKDACNEGGQITPLTVEGDNSRLRVRNANSGDPIDLHYVLRFKRKIPILFKPHEYDPVIRNGGGGGGR